MLQARKPQQGLDTVRELARKFCLTWCDLTKQVPSVKFALAAPLAIGKASLEHAVWFLFHQFFLGVFDTGILLQLLELLNRSLQIELGCTMQRNNVCAKYFNYSNFATTVGAKTNQPLSQALKTECP